MKSIYMVQNDKRVLMSYIAVLAAENHSLWAGFLYCTVLIQLT